MSKLSAAILSARAHTFVFLVSLAVFCVSTAAAQDQVDSELAAPPSEGESTEKPASSDIITSVESIEEEEEEVSPVSISDSIPSIPGPRKGRERLIIDKNNVREFRDLLLAPVASWIEADLLSLRAISNLEYRWKFSNSWEKASRSAFQSFELDDEKNLVLQGESGAPKQGLPFGSRDIIELEKDQSRKAQKILWNSIYSMWAQGNLLYDMELSWVGTQSVLRKSEGVFYKKLYFDPTKLEITDSAAQVDRASSSSSSSLPKTEEAETEKPKPILISSEKATSFGSSGDILSREFLQLNSPAVVYGFAQLTWRYRGEADDKVWIFSPVIGKSRSVQSANRSDSILGGRLTLDDLFVWGTKLQNVDMKVVDEKVLLVPYSSISAYQVEMGNTLPASTVLLRQGQKLQAPKNAAVDLAVVRGYHQRINGTTMTVLWNHELKRYQSGSPWIPVTAVFVPRKVWILELTPRNPYYSSGKELLIVDQESMLPAYKIVYAKGGKYLKTIVAGWALAKGKTNDVRFPFLSFVIAVDRGARQVMTMSTAGVTSATSSKSATFAELDSLFDMSQHETVEEDKP